MCAIKSIDAYAPVAAVDTHFVMRKRCRMVVQRLNYIRIGLLVVGINCSGYLMSDE